MKKQISGHKREREHDEDNSTDQPPLKKRKIDSDSNETVQNNPASLMQHQDNSEENVIQLPVSDPFNDQHPLTIAKKQRWDLFDQYLKDGTFKPEQFADLNEPAVFGILEAEEKYELLQSSRVLALKHPMNVLFYLDIDTMRVESNDELNHSYSCTMRLMLDSKMAFGPLYFGEDDDGYLTIFHDKVKEFFQGFASEDFMENDFNLQKDLSFDYEDTVEIVLYQSPDKQRCDNFKTYAQKYLTNQKKWLALGYDKARALIKCSLFSKEKRNQSSDDKDKNNDENKVPDDIINIITSCILPPK